jgi:DMSO/TMAO reductase YedYZ molybdopterin-dependent catalytic subunit
MPPARGRSTASVRIFYEFRHTMRSIATGWRAALRGGPPRRVNLALALLLVAAVLTGLLSDAIGVDWPLDPAAVHGAVAIAIILLAPWKSIVMRRGLRRRRPGRCWSLALLALVLTALGSGLAHATGLVEQVGPLTTMQVHVGAAVTALALALVHYRMHPVRPHRTDLDRRMLLRTTALAAAATAGLTVWEAALGASRLPGGGRRFTGSVEQASGDPAAMPVVAWIDDRVQRIDPDAWRLRVGDTEYDLAAIQALPQGSFTATLDCTGGWFSRQRWQGVRLDRLVDPGTDRWRSVEVRSATGYALRFPLRDLGRLWLVTHAGGAPLTAGHGFPARIVAPGRRGFWWVKWVVSIRLSAVPWWLQPPFPLT